jgi:hypothetical protein
MSASGKLGSANVASANTKTTVYTVPGSVSFATVSVNILNPTTTEASINLYYTSTPANPGAADGIEHGAKIPANGGSLLRTCEVLGPGESVVVSSDVAGIVVRVSGLEK